MVRYWMIFWSVLWVPLLGNAQSDYFFPKETTFNPSVPSPEVFLGYPIGTYHTRYDQVVAYFRLLAQTSPRATLQTIGYTYEQRPQIILTISDESNFTRIEEIRKNHLEIANPGTPLPSLDKEPVVMLLGYNVHGNEPSSTEAALLTAYYLVASEKDLKNAIVHIDPAYNPDGRDRHTHWVNTARSQNLNADPMDREHNEAWPGGRTNHYWFDLNRDWLPVSQIESKNRIAFYHSWLPNVATDYHEMGTSSTYFFEPTERFGAENPLVPRSNYDDLNQIFAGYFASSLDEIGSLYFTRESFDNSYPGYGNTYPDIHGGLGLLFEQASSRGHLQETSTKPISFEFTIRNQVRTGLATVQAALDHRVKLLKHQREFFDNALNDGKKSKYQSIVFGDENDRGKTNAFLDFLAMHRIQTFQLETPVSSEGKSYAYIVPTSQPQFKMIQTIFEPVTTFHDSVFYDASGWAAVYSFHMPHQKLVGVPAYQPIPLPIWPKASQDKSDYAYLIEYTDYRAPKIIYELQQKGVFIKAAFRPFQMNVAGGQQKQFGYGTLLIPVADQYIDSDSLYQLLKNLEMDVFPVHTGKAIHGIDLGSGNFKTIRIPKAAMLTGAGISQYEAGEIWHLLDTRFNMPVTKVDITSFSRLQLDRYNVLILVSGNYSALSKQDIQEIKRWNSKGGTLIVLKSAVDFAIKEGLVNEQIKSPEYAGLGRKDFDQMNEIMGSRQTGGSVYLADLDISHPIGFGYSERKIYVYRNHNLCLLPSKSSFATVVKYLNLPQVDGYVHRENLPFIQESASVIAQSSIVLFADNPNFRGFWYGTNKLFLNALFFGNHF
jgi:hypothetical protein